ncbi:MAG: hypothetical protein Ct9H300mP11_18490 [Chloroflexota bacterium]|nr:MAG: hypothetical protein Ct9H300mP11_18490 [Chloroflexota bacterium]
MYNYFVADEPQIPAWRLTPPRDQAAIEAMEKAYWDSTTPSRRCWKYYSLPISSKLMRHGSQSQEPRRMVVSLLRMTGEFKGYKPGLFDYSQEPKYMGMD